MLSADTILQNRYQVIRPIGEGGMGAVYLATDRRLGNTVALKQTLFDDNMRRRAFEREARLLASLRHPALPRVSDHFIDENGQFLVMEYIAGEDLGEMRANQEGGFFPVPVVLEWADQLLDALDYLHTQEPTVIHRDIKPQNLKLTPRGQIILLDFGLAKGAIGQNVSNVNTAHSTTSIFGYTPNFAPLEQIQGVGTDPRSDLYALAATLYYLLTGTRPPDALTRATAVLNNQPDPLLPANEVTRLVPPDVASVLSQAMSQNREQRPMSAAAMRQMLRATHTANSTAGTQQNAMFIPSSSTEPTLTSPIDNARTVQIANLSSNANIASDDAAIEAPTVAHTQNVVSPDAAIQSYTSHAGNTSVGSNSASDEPSVVTKVHRDVRTSETAPLAAYAPISSSSQTSPHRSRRAWALGGVAAILIVGVSFAALNAKRFIGASESETPAAIQSPQPKPNPTQGATKGNETAREKVKASETPKTEAVSSNKATPTKARKGDDNANERTKNENEDATDEQKEAESSTSRSRSMPHAPIPTPTPTPQRPVPLDPGAFNAEGSNEVQKPPQRDQQRGQEQNQDVPLWRRRMNRREQRQERKRERKENNREAPPNQ